MLDGLVNTYECCFLLITIFTSGTLSTLLSEAYGKRARNPNALQQIDAAFLGVLGDGNAFWCVFSKPSRYDFECVGENWTTFSNGDGGKTPEPLDGCTLVERQVQKAV